MAMGVAGLLFAAVLALRLILSNPLDAISMLYLFPIALVAMTKGRWGGLLGGLVAVVLVVLWVVVQSVALSAMGWSSRVLPLLLVGSLIGDARDRLTRAAAEHAVHEVAEQRHREAIEINDSLVQGMSAAKWSIEAGRTEAGLDALRETVERGHRLVSELIRDAGVGSSATR
jgi:K+-sensing histidine kinase KdpD